MIVSKRILNKKVIAIWMKATIEMLRKEETKNQMTYSTVIKRESTT